IAERFYRDNDRLLEGGIWAEVTLAHNEIDDDDYAFSVEDLRPIQLTRFDFNRYVEGRGAFTRDEWLSAVLRSVGLEPTKLSRRVQMHFIARLAALVEPNYNYIELGPRGTGKSYFFSEFSPYATLISGGQATKATLFYNNARRKVGLVGYWDTVAFDEVGGIKVRDPDTIQIMKDFMANGRFSRGAEVIADASLSFVGNIDVSVQQVVNSNEHDLFQPLPPELDLAVMDRFAAFIPGWEMPKNSSEFLTANYGFITDYLAEAFHYQFKHTNRYEEVSQRIRLGKAIEGRDEKGIKKTVCAFLKILHPNGPPSDSEFEEYVSYAVECRRRVKEQMNKRKPDDEFANIGLSYFNAGGSEIVVYCPESKDAAATQNPARRKLHATQKAEDSTPTSTVAVEEPVPARQSTPASASTPSIEQSSITAPTPVEASAQEKHFTILYGDVGYSYESIVGPYLSGAKSVVIEDPYIRLQHQISNFVRFCETVIKPGAVRKITLITGHDDKAQLADMAEKLEELKQSLLEADVELEVRLNPNIHDREIRLDNGWVIKIGRGLDFYQKPSSWFEVGAHDLNLRKCLETKVDIFRAEGK
ncbi:MAG: BREX system Lon protease-like protein BrxL, partial [Gammaproteobacteria bacterium]|nr:BREX system Lon protease-like protein BrxL [Gammaproteobacteria bacterium]